MMKKRMVAMILSVSMAGSFLVAERGEANSNLPEVKDLNDTMIEYNQSVLTPMELMRQIFQPKRSHDIASGAWAMNEGSTLPKDNPEAMQAFNNAMRDFLGGHYEVMAILGSQVVAGINYAYLCKGKAVIPKAKSAYVIVYVYENLEGKATVMGIKDLLQAAQEGMTGGWQYNQGKPALKDNLKLSADFKKAMADFEGTYYSPMAYLGSQVTTGTNYALFCSARETTLGAKRKFSIVTINSDLNGKATLVDIADVSI